MATARRILYVNHVAEASGAENSLLALMSVLDRKRFFPILACPEDGDLPRRAAAMSVEVHSLPIRRLRRTRDLRQILKTLLDVADVLRRLRHLAEEEGVCLIHANSATAQLSAAPAARLLGIPSVWHVRDLTLPGWIARGLYHFSSRIIAISRAVARRISPRDGRDEKIVVIPNGIDAEAFSAGAAPGQVKAELGLPPEQKVVAIVGQIVPWKGHRTFLHAMARLPEAVGLVVGSDQFGDHPDLVASLDALRRELGLQERVRFLGWRNDVRDILAEADVLAVPSEAEPFGRVALEAMALGKPVVGTNAGGLPEVVCDGETGLLVSPGDAEALASAIRSLLRDPARAAAMGQAGRERVRTYFDIRTCARRVERVYEELLGGTPCA